MRVPPLLAALPLVACTRSADRPASDDVGTTCDPLRACPAGPTTRGIDVSVYQGTIDWVAVAAAGRAFAFVRVSDGIDGRDARFDANWAGSKAAGIPRGAYQFFRPEDDPEAQAALVPTDGDLPAVLDLEVTDGQTDAALVAAARRWIAAVTASTGRPPLVYTAAVLSDVLGDALAASPLWVANYDVDCPELPTGWTDWIFWQTGTTRVDGIDVAVDDDVFQGTLDDLRAYVGTPDAGIIDAGAPRT